MEDKEHKERAPKKPVNAVCDLCGRMQSASGRWRRAEMPPYPGCHKYCPDCEKAARDEYYSFLGGKN